MDIFDFNVYLTLTLCFFCLIHFILCYDNDAVA